MLPDQNHPVWLSLFVQPVLFGTKYNLLPIVQGDNCVAIFSNEQMIGVCVTILAALYTAVFNPLNPLIPKDSVDFLFSWQMFIMGCSGSGVFIFFAALTSNFAGHFIFEDQARQENHKRRLRWLQLV